jgi:hypothetical protein
MGMSYIGVAADPVDLVMPAFGQDLFLALTGVAFAVCLVKALMLLKAKRDDTFLILLLAGMACIALEAFATTLIKCTHPPIGSYAVYSAFGKVIPLHLMLAYGAFFGGSSYLLLARMRQNPSPSLFWKAYVIIALLNVAIEITAVRLGVWVYNDTQPFVVADYPLYTSFLNATLAVSFAAVSFFWLSNVRGARRWLLVILAPLAAIGIYTAEALPIAAALFGSTTVPQAILGGLATIAVCLFIAVLAQRALVMLARRPTAGT